jgi:dihydrofolate reductase
MLSVSLDSMFEGPRHELDWQIVDDELHRYFNAQLSRMSAFIDGRRTYELMASYWPTADRDPASPPPIVEFARIWRDMPKYVYSRTLERAEWNTTIVREVDAAEIQALKGELGGDMAIGGAELAAAFLRLDLIDEFWLYVNPIILGSGNPLFPRQEQPVKLRLEETKQFGSGVVLLRYGRA